MFLLPALFAIISAIPVPSGFQRGPASSWGQYLRTLPLRQDNTVYLYNGQKKRNQSAQFAVIDIPVGDKDLQQCADAVMRLRAEYLFASRQFNKIEFADNNGKKYRFSEPYTREHLERFLITVFSNCNSASLEKQLRPKAIKDIAIGDVLIKGGFPGHVVIVTDVATNAKGEKIYMLAQSYMPAQDIHVLKGEDGPWYKVREGVIQTPEYTFYSSQLRTW